MNRVRLLPPTLSLPHKGGGNAHHHPLPLDGGGFVGLPLKRSFNGDPRRGWSNRTLPGAFA